MVFVGTPADQKTDPYVKPTGYKGKVTISAG